MRVLFNLLLRQPCIEIVQLYSFAIVWRLQGRWAANPVTLCFLTSSLNHCCFIPFRTNATFDIIWYICAILQCLHKKPRAQRSNTGSWCLQKTKSTQNTCDTCTGRIMLWIAMVMLGTSLILDFADGQHDNIQWFKHLVWKHVMLRCSALAKLPSQIFHSTHQFGCLTIRSNALQYMSNMFQ